MLTSVERALTALKFIGQQGSVGVIELAQYLGIDKSNASRLLRLLQKHEFVRRNSTTGKYSLGLSLLGLAHDAVRSFNLKDLLRPFLKELSVESKETITLFVRVEDGAVCIDIVESPNYLRTHVEIGSVIPLHAGSTSKALLAYMPKEKAAEIINREPYPAFTPNTITSARLLGSKLEEIRQFGYATSIEETAYGAAGVAAPVLNQYGHAIAAIGIGGPVTRIPMERLRILGQLVRRVAARASQDVGKHFNDTDL